MTTEIKSVVLQDATNFVEDTAEMSTTEKALVLGYIRGLADGSRINMNTESKPA